MELWITLVDSYFFPWLDSYQTSWQIKKYMKMWKYFFKILSWHFQFKIRPVNSICDRNVTRQCSWLNQIIFVQLLDVYMREYFMIISAILHRQFKWKTCSHYFSLNFWNQLAQVLLVEFMCSELNGYDYKKLQLIIHLIVFSCDIFVGKFKISHPWLRHTCTIIFNWRNYVGICSFLCSWFS